MEAYDHHDIPSLLNRLESKDSSNRYEAVRALESRI
jgi:hypothetical protein